MEQDTLELLEKLQGHADAIDRLQARRQAAAENLERVEEKLAKSEETLAEKEERSHAIDMERRKRELTLKGERERLARIKGRLGEVKTSREYQAVLSETSAAKQTISDAEEALTRDLQEHERAAGEVDELRTLIQGIREDREGASSELETARAETEGELTEHQTAEETLLRSLPVEVVDRYRLIRSRRGGLAVVEARDEACTACFMRIPPQTYIEVVRRTRVIQCPNCHRILVPPREAPEAGAEAGAE